MEAVNPQKIKLLKLYEMLRQHTDEDRPLSTNQLCAMLEEEGITCDRRTLAEDIDILNANGFEVLRRRTSWKPCLVMNILKHTVNQYLGVL